MAEIAQDRASCSKMRQDHGLDPSRLDLPGLDLVLGLPNPSLVNALADLPDPSKICGVLMTKSLLVCGKGLAQCQLQLFLWDPSLPCRSHVGKITNIFKNRQTLWIWTKVSLPQMPVCPFSVCPSGRVTPPSWDSPVAEAVGHRQQWRCVGVSSAVVVPWWGLFGPPCPGFTPALSPVASPHAGGMGNHPLSQLCQAQLITLDKLAAPESLLLCLCDH